jgi:hypothetical protein
MVGQANISRDGKGSVPLPQSWVAIIRIPQYESTGIVLMQLCANTQPVFSRFR